MSRVRLLAVLLTAVLTGSCDQAAQPPEQENTYTPTAPAGSVPIDMVTVPAGAFLFGSNDVDTQNRAQEFGGRRPWYEDEHPLQSVELGAFRIDRTEVTENQYLTFIQQIGYPPPAEWDGPTPVHPQRPVVDVNWMDAQNYCHWRGARLPSELEWEKAARGTGGGIYPWGNPFHRDKANVGQTGEVADVSHFPDSASPYGAQDMAGNVWEWTSSWYLPYPGNSTPSELYGKHHKVLKGGSAGAKGGHYLLEEITTRASYRFFLDPRIKSPDAGFRCVQSLDADGKTVDDRDEMLHR